MTYVEKRKPSLAISAAIALGFTLTASHALGESIVKQPGNHPAYSVDLEPHLVLALDNSPYSSRGGFGLGGRLTIPFLRNGPIASINNDMGIGIGLDWVTQGSCYRGSYWQPYYSDCSMYALYVPVVLQWNFYLTDIITVFGEPGLALRYARVSVNGVNNGLSADGSYSATAVVPVIAAGAKFMFGRTIGLNVRLGFPYVTAGVSILL